MKIVYLYSELGPYNVPVLRCLVRDHSAEVHVIHWDRRRLKPYQAPEIPGVTYHRRSELSPPQIREMVRTFSPDLVYISGWMDPGYFPAALMCRRAGIPVVTGFDDQWTGSLRQRVGSIIFPLWYRRFFSHAWVAGPRQYEFARRLGFERRDIIFDMLSCDFDLFRSVGANVDRAKRSYPQAFLYVGNFRAVKGTDLLAEAFQKYRNDLGGTWRLVCIGNGELEPLLRRCSGIEVKPFLSQTELAEQCATAGVFVLPSRHDQWGVVVHEFAAAGLPMLLSENVGAMDLFFIEGFNGFSFQGNSMVGLANAMLRFSTLPEGRLLDMAANGRRLAGRIDPTMSAASLASVVVR